MLTAPDRDRVAQPYRTTLALPRGLVLSGVLTLGFAVGGVLHVQLTNRFLEQIIHASTRAAYVGDASTAYHYLDALFGHTLAYCALALVACGTGVFYLTLRQSAPETVRPIANAQARQQRPCPPALTAAMVFAASVLGGGLLDRALIKWRFTREGISSAVSTDAVLYPFYAYDTLYQRLTIATGVALLLLWLVGRTLPRVRSR